MDGYTRLAALMADQDEYAVFRRYIPLRALRLLHLSAKITRLGNELGLAIDLDRHSQDPEKEQFESYYRLLEKSRDSLEPSRQLEIWEELSAALKEQGIQFQALSTSAKYRMLQAKPFCSIALSSGSQQQIKPTSRIYGPGFGTTREDITFCTELKRSCGTISQNRI